MNSGKVESIRAVKVGYLKGLLGIRKSDRVMNAGIGVWSDKGCG